MTQSEILGPFASLTELVGAIQAGEVLATEQLYRIFASGFRTLFARRIEAEDLDDVLHDCYLVTVGAIAKGKLREPEALMGFIHTTMQRQYAAHVESRSAERERRQWSETAYLPSRAPSGEEVQILREEREVAERALAKIRPRYAEILQRAYLLEETKEEIRAAMQLTERQYNLGKSRALDALARAGKKIARLPKRKRLAVLCHANAPDPACRRCQQRLRYRNEREQDLPKAA